MAVEKINKDLYVGSTGLQLNNIHKRFEKYTKDKDSGFAFCKIGEWYDGRPIYEAVGDLGYLPNASTKTFNYTLPNFNGMLDCNFIAYNSGGRIVLPYLYPNTSYIDYWITLEIISDKSVQVICGTDRSGYKLWGHFIYVGTE